MSETREQIINGAAERIWCARQVIANCEHPNDANGLPYLRGEVRRAVEQSDAAPNEETAVVREALSRLANRVIATGKAAKRDYCEGPKA